MVNHAVELTDIPRALFEQENAPLLTGILRGIEKESLRVTTEGHLAHTPHPAVLGSALTHPQITTDFSEALLEFITPPSHRIGTLLEQLQGSHQYTYQHLGDELLWSSSMPCMVGNEADIPVALYGSSNRAKMKTIYRVGLGHRYGRTMQTVAGVHFNFSLATPFWAFMHQHEGSSEDLDDFITRRYFDLIRNFRRNYWLLIYLFGSSPAICRSFVKGREHTLIPFNNDDHTLHLPFATSLRMGDLGYQSSAQESLYVCYNSRASYVKTLGRAIATPYPPYQEVGLRNSAGDYLQLNTSLLQIENEFYSAIRPKRTAQKAETALTALCRRGVEYIEVRCLDLDPYAPLGVTAEQLRFLDVFLLHCALHESPLCDKQEFARIAQNQKSVVNEGRKPGLVLQRPAGGEITLSVWAEQLCQELQPIAELLDSAHGNADRYSKALLVQQQKVADVNLTPSARVLNDMREHNLSFAQWGLSRARAHRDYFAALAPNASNEQRFADMAEESLALQAEEEAQPQAPFDDYLNAYYQQYHSCD